MNAKPVSLVDQLARLVCKTGVVLGGLPAVQQRLALALAATCIEVGPVHTEVQVTAALRACLDAEASFLASDAVALRRWLIDGGWWMRDGFGRAYQRLPSQALRPALQPYAWAVHGLSLRDWVPAQRAAQRQWRETQRQAWLLARTQPAREDS